jgi:Domain of unknown function (DUF4193)
MRENQEMKDLDNEEEEDASLDDDEDDESAAASGFGEDDEEGDDSSLEQLLAQRSAARRGSDEPEENEDLMALASEREPPLRGESLNPRLIPVKDRQEFVCKRCFLVKARSQLADAERVLCRDCV